MGHPTDPDELLELPGDELGAVIRDDPRPRRGESLPGPLHDGLDVLLGHARADLPVDEEPTAAVEEAAEVEEGPADVDVRNIDVPATRDGVRLCSWFLRDQGWCQTLFLVLTCCVRNQEQSLTPQSLTHHKV